MRVLMIEDDQSYYSFIRRVLLSCDQPKFSINRAKSIAEAKEHLSWETPDVVLVDLNLQDSSGLATLGKVLELAGDVPIVVLTGSDDQQIGLQAVALGAQDYLVKHLVGNDSVIRCIRYAIERRKSEESTLRLAAIKDFTATLAHDLKVPFIGAKNVYHALISGQFGELTAEQTKVMVDLERNNESQLGLIQRLLEVYRYEVGAPDLEFKTVDIAQLISQSLANLAKRYPQAVPIISSASRDLPAISGDGDALGQLFDNLLDNAAKFSNGHSEIKIHSEITKGKLAVHIHNYGLVIPNEVQAGLFQKFWQGVPGKSYVARTGLGLYLCHRIATLHRGKIACHSTQEEGTTITVILPVMPDE